MKKIVVLVLVVLLVGVGAGGKAAEANKVMCTLDEFVARFNECLVEVEYEKYYGVDATLTKEILHIEAGEFNDTISYMFPDYEDGFILLTLEKGTENILWIAEMFDSSGPSRQPERLLEFMTVLSYCSGGILDTSDVVEVMRVMGMYKPGAFAQGVTAKYNGVNCSLKYKSMTISARELIYAYAKIN